MNPILRNIFLLFIVVLLLVAIAYQIQKLFYSDSQTAESANSSTEQSDNDGAATAPAIPDGPGYIYLSLKKTGEQIYTVPYQINMEAAPLLLPEKVVDLPSHSATYDRASKTIYTVSVSDLSFERNEADPEGVHTVSLEDLAYDPLRNNFGFNEQRLSWSSAAERLVYTYQWEKTPEDSLNIANWSVAIVDPKTGVAEHTIDGANDASWGPDGQHILYIGNDGIYQYSLETQQNRRRIAVENPEIPFTMQHKLDVSEDGTLAAINDPFSGMIKLFEVADWEGDMLDMNVVKEISVEGKQVFSSVISPDNAALAVIAMDADLEANTLSNPELVVLDIESGESLHTVSLADFESDAIFLDDWLVDQIK